MGAGGIGRIWGIIQQQEQTLTMKILAGNRGQLNSALYSIFLLLSPFNMNGEQLKKFVHYVLAKPRLSHKETLMTSFLATV